MCRLRQRDLQSKHQMKYPEKKLKKKARKQAAGDFLGGLEV